MKKLLFVAVLFCSVALASNAQEFKPFRVDAGIGYALPFTDGFDGGVSFYLEPKYEVAPQIAVGIRWEGALFGGDSDISLSSAYFATGDYYFNNNKFRPFVGLGLGVYGIGGISVDVPGGGTLDVDAKNNFGVLVRAGFDISHFRLAASYTYGGKYFDETFHFFGVSIGFYLGGGRN